MYLPTKKPSASTSRGQEILVVPPQFTPQRGLTGSRQIRRLYRALPVFPYWSLQESRSERNSRPRLSLPCTNRQLSGKAFGSVLIFIHAFCFRFHSVYHRNPRKSIEICKVFPIFYKFFLFVRVFSTLREHSSPPCREIA